MATWEQRWHPLRQEWVIVAAHRQHRPWIGGKVASSEASARVPYLADCYLCPGNRRVSAAQNPNYASVFFFENDHPCVSLSAPDAGIQDDRIFQARPARGVAKVGCYSPRHDLTLTDLAVDELFGVLQSWQTEYRLLAELPDVRHVLIFENKGEVVGVSNPHPHCQIYATDFVFKTIETEVGASRQHLERTGRVLFADLLAAEQADGRRVIAQNDHAIGFLPYFARYAYETYVSPKRTYPSIAHVPNDELLGLARVLKQVLVRFDNLWQMPFPYVMVLHQAPTDGGDYRSFHFHIEFHPPLRQPNLLKYLAGPEIGGGNFLSDTCPEDKAAELRDVSDNLYREPPK